MANIMNASFSLLSVDSNALKTEESYCFSYSHFAFVMFLTDLQSTMFVSYM